MTEQESRTGILVQILETDGVFIVESKTSLYIVFSSTRQPKNLPTIGACTGAQEVLT
jgi:hypothetical protein